VQRSAPRCNRNTSGSAVVQVLDKGPQASIERNFFEHTLPAQRIVHEGQRNEIGKRCRTTLAKSELNFLLSGDTGLLPR